MIELYDEFFSMLRFAKNLCEYDMADQLKNWFGSCPLDTDYYWELTYETIGWVFQSTCHYYNEEAEIETWLFMDPAIDHFCQVCQKYEERKNIAQEDNPYQKKMEQIIHEAFSFNSYSYGYDWRLSDKKRGRRGLLLFTGCEFCSHDAIFYGLMEIKDGFDAITAHMEAELAKETRIIPLSLVTAAQWKEAA